MERIMFFVDISENTTETKKVKRTKFIPRVISYWMTIISDFLNERKLKENTYMKKEINFIFPVLWYLRNFF